MRLAPVLAVLGDASVQGDGVFTLTQTANSVRAEKVLTNGLRLVKEFQLSTNYLVRATVQSGEHVQPAAHVAGAGMGHWHRHADGPG